LVDLGSIINATDFHKVGKPCCVSAHGQENRVLGVFVGGKAAREHPKLILFESLETQQDILAFLWVFDTMIEILTFLIQVTCDCSMLILL
jgi:hypothetical protein